MTSLTLAVVLHLSLAATAADAPAEETYAEAHHKTAETGQPMVVMVGADWCPACQYMEHNIIPQVRKRGIFRRIAFALVNLDREPELGRSLTQGGPIPQLIVFRRGREGWQKTKLIGGQSVEKVEQLLSQEVELSQTDRPAATSVSVQQQPAKQPAVRPIQQAQRADLTTIHEVSNK